jgi:HTTM domain/Vitamin K-dependent gamma-carboxylase, lumenal domain
VRFGWEIFTLKQHFPKLLFMVGKSQKQIEKLLSKAEIHDLRGSGKWKHLFAQVDISTLVLFRILFGLIMLVEVYRYFDHGWIARYWINPDHHFTYWPFDFLSPLPGNGMYVLFYFMGALSVCILLGLFYRFSIISFFLCFSYIFLLDQTRYLNHFYLVILFSFVLIFLPANKSASLDARYFPKIRSETCSAWPIWLLRFMVGIPYFFGGVAKLNPDWLRGQPLGVWLSDKTDFPIIGSFFQERWMTLLMSYSGMLLDLLIVPLLLFKKTRTFGLVAIILFHLMNARLFQIGIFPWFMIASCVVFFNPDWFRKLFKNLFGKNRWSIVLPSKDEWSQPSFLTKKQKMILVGLAIWVGIQVMVPLRHWYFPGNVSWTEEGHRFAWHMKLRTKRGNGVYTVKDKKTGQQQIIDINDYITSRQEHKVEDRPYLIWQFCQIVKKEFAKSGFDVSVYADVKASLNGRKYQQLIDPSIDLASVPRDVLSHSTWIIPLQIPLEDQR